LAYSVEVREQDGDAVGGDIPAHNVRIGEIMRSIDAAAEFEAHNVTAGLPPGKTWTAVKLTALLPDAGTIERYSRYISNTRTNKFLRDIPFPYSPRPKDLHVLSARSPPAPMTQEDLESIKNLYRELRALCSRARDKGVTLVFDAEHSWYATSFSSKSPTTADSLIGIP
jgi:proline dehydrogenase